MNENEMKLLEEQMLGWQPRRPSAGLKWRIFGGACARSSFILNLPRMARLAGLATPMTACALAMLLVMNSGNSLAPRAMAVPSTSAMISNSEYAVLATSRQSEQNRLCAVTFDWTNGGGFNSNVPSFLPGN